MDGINSYTCDCASGFTGDRCETNIDECVSNPCESGGTCEDRINSYTCSCSDSFTGNLCETFVPGMLFKSKNTFVIL